ncbi:MAG: molybdopterin molybdotransferase MoeA [Oligoflexia bacterium]|nr:molybdopterin molybdotransferase MoeA [Oligoflexia bacterium]
MSLDLNFKLITSDNAYKLISKYIDDNIHSLISHWEIAQTLIVPLMHSKNMYLGKNVLAQRNAPPFDRIGMDGIAINFEHAKENKLYSFPIEGTQYAGHEVKSLQSMNNCIEVMTGAPLPHGCNTVIPYEDLKIDSNKNILTACLQLNIKEIKEGSNILKSGSDYIKGNLLLKKGTKLNSSHLGILASEGIENVTVFKNPLENLPVMVISTGDEVITDFNLELLPYQIRSSNIYSICSELEENGLKNINVCHFKDDKIRMLKELSEILKKYAVIIICGGISKGKFDFVAEVLSELKVEKIFHGVAQKPGKPLYFGYKNESLIFALPGNPLSSLICLRRYVIEGLKKFSALTISSTLSGPSIPPDFSSTIEKNSQPSLDSPSHNHQHDPLSTSPKKEDTSLYSILAEDIKINHKKANSFTQFFPVKVTFSNDAHIYAKPLIYNNSGDYLSLRDSDGFISVINDDSDNFDNYGKIGNVYPLYLWGKGF